jgi:hypothetical protein
MHEEVALEVEVAVHEGELHQRRGAGEIEEAVDEADVLEMQRCQVRGGEREGAPRLPRRGPDVDAGASAGQWRSRGPSSRRPCRAGTGAWPRGPGTTPGFAGPERCLFGTRGPRAFYFLVVVF